MTNSTLGAIVYYSLDVHFNHKRGRVDVWNTLQLERTSALFSDYNDDRTLALDAAVQLFVEKFGEPDQTDRSAHDLSTGQRGAAVLAQDRLDPAQNGIAVPVVGAAVHAGVCPQLCRRKVKKEVS